MTKYKLRLFLLLPRSVSTIKRAPLNRSPFWLSTGSTKSITWSKHLLPYNCLNSSRNLYISKKYFQKKYFPKLKSKKKNVYYSVGYPKSTDNKAASLILHHTPRRSLSCVNSNWVSPRGILVNIGHKALLSVK